MDDGTGGADRLAGILRQLADDPTLRATLGRFGRQLVVDRFSLQRAALAQVEIYRQALTRQHTATRQHAATRRWNGFVEGSRSAGGLLAYKLRRRFDALRGTRTRDDFNAVTLAQAALRK